MFMKKSDAVVPYYLNDKLNSKIYEAAALVLGVLMLAVLAQLSIPLPFTPVPVTGQTFGVSLIALLWGGRRGFQVIALYLLVGACGLPVFANAASGLAMGPTLGYLVGMLAASWVIGTLAERGWLRTRFKAWAAAQLGSVFVFGFGVFGLSFFLPQDQLLMAGVLPFLPGDFIKTTLSSSIAFELRNRIGGQK